VLKGRSQEDIKNCQVNDDLVGPIYQVKLEGTRPSEESVEGKDPKYRRLVQIWNQLVIKDTVLWTLFESNDGSRHTYQLVVPEVLKSEVLHDIHEGVLGSYLGVDKSLGRLKERFYWPDHFNGVKQWCFTCVRCVTRKPGGRKRKAPLQPVVVWYHLRLVAVDIVGPLPETDEVTLTS